MLYWIVLYYTVLFPIIPQSARQCACACLRVCTPHPLGAPMHTSMCMASTSSAATWWVRSGSDLQPRTPHALHELANLSPTHADSMACAGLTGCAELGTLCRVLGPARRRRWPVGLASALSLTVACPVVGGRSRARPVCRPTDRQGGVPASPGPPPPALRRHHAEGLHEGEGRAEVAAAPGDQPAALTALARPWAPPPRTRARRAPI